MNHTMASSHPDVTPILRSKRCSVQFMARDSKTRHAVDRHFL
jgi:hypothetical protein